MLIKTTLPMKSNYQKRPICKKRTKKCIANIVLGSGTYWSLEGTSSILFCSIRYWLKVSSVFPYDVKLQA
eukprot:2783420-Amphidinium_carterae.1